MSEIKIKFSVYPNPLKDEEGRTTYQVRQDTIGTMDTKGLEMHILHADCRADAEQVKSAVLAAHPDMGEITVTSLGVVIGAHCGPGLLTVFYLCSGRRPE